MDWIKAKYDRFLLGLCGLIALIIGGLLLIKSVGWKSANLTAESQAVAAKKGKETAPTNSAEAVAAAVTRLKSVAKINPPMDDDFPRSLFSSAPVIKMAGKKDAQKLFGPGAEPIRPPVDNKWLYVNNLDLRQVNILDKDDDGDKFTNLEEYNADPKTNPRDAASHPPVSAKIQYKELIQDPLTLKFNNFSSATEVTFRVIGATPETAFTTKFLNAGDKIQFPKGGDDRFVLDKIDASVAGKEKVSVTDLKSGRKADILVKGEEQFPTNRAKLVCTLGKEEEKVVSKGDEVTFEADPEQSYSVKDITPTEVTMEYTPKGTSEKKKLVLKIPTPP
jgi:hypothetical protein